MEKIKPDKEILKSLPGSKEFITELIFHDLPGKINLVTN